MLLGDLFFIFKYVLYYYIKKYNSINELIRELRIVNLGGNIIENKIR